MTKRTRTVMVLLMSALGLIGCDGPVLPSAPSTVSNLTPEVAASAVYSLTASSKHRRDGHGGWLTESDW